MIEKSNNKDTVTINLEPFLMPLAIFLSAVVIGMSMVMSAERLKINVGSGSTTPPTTVTPPTTPPAANPTVSLDTIKNLYNTSDHIKFGDANRKNLFVEIGDPSCPYCQIAAGKNGELNKTAGTRFTLVADGGTYVSPVEEMRKLVDAGQASFLYIYYPGHGKGEMAMLALYCANDQGKFWEAHDKLMTSAGYDLQENKVQNDRAKSQQMVDFLSGVGNSGELKNCIDSGKYENRLKADVSSATTLGVTGTPGFYVNATNFPGAYSWPDMTSALVN